MTRIAQPYVVYGLLALAVLLPLLLPGYVLTSDMIFTPTLPMPEAVSSSYPYHALLHGASLLLPSQLIQKVLLIAAIFGASLGMHKLIVALQPRQKGQTPWAIYAAGILFAINPFTYARFMTGQLAVVLGYALLPWLLLMLIRLARRPTPGQAIAAGLLLAVIGMISIHTLGLAFVLGCIGLVMYVYKHRHHPKQLIPRLRLAGASLAVFLFLSSFWIVPLLQGEGRTAEAINRFTSGDITAFETTGSSTANKLIHIARLQGFWAEQQGLFLMPQNTLPLWGLVVLAVWMVVGVGWATLWQHQRYLAVYVLLCSGAAAILALGVLSEWLARHVPFFAGYREPHKFVGLICLCYAVAFAYGAGVLMRKLRPYTNGFVLGTTALLVLPFLLTPSMFWGFARQLEAQQYPNSWYRANDLLNADQDDYRALFLPWHHYMSFTFAHRIIANPADQFFDKEILVSPDPEIKGVRPHDADPVATRVASVLRHAENRRDLGVQLAPHNIKYILLAKEFDYKKYDFLQHQTDLRRISNSEHLIIYKNTAWREP